MKVKPTEMFLPSRWKSKTRHQVASRTSITVPSASCRASTLRRWATKPNVKKKLKLKYSFGLVIHVPLCRLNTKSQISTPTCLESMLGLRILQLNSPLSLQKENHMTLFVLGKSKLIKYFSQTEKMDGQQ